MLKTGCTDVGRKIQRNVLHLYCNVYGLVAVEGR